MTKYGIEFEREGMSESVIYLRHFQTAFDAENEMAMAILQMPNVKRARVIQIKNCSTLDMCKGYGGWKQNA